MAVDQASALVLREAGADYQQIATALKCTAEDAERAVIAAVAAAQVADEVSLTLVRLNTMFTALWPKARSGDIQAIQTCLVIMDRRARLQPSTGDSEHDDLKQLRDEREQRLAAQRRGRQSGS